MPVIESTINASSADFHQNTEQMGQALQQVRDIEQRVNDAAVAKKASYAKRNLLLPRERLALLLDPGSSFIELSTLAGFMMEDDKDGSGAGGGAIIGIGYVSGVRCVVHLDNFAVKGGTVSNAGMQKKLRMQRIALENKLPIVSLSQSGGANLKYAAVTFSEGGALFCNQARMSAAGIPQVTVVHGSATAGGAYQPGLSDYVVMVKQQATMYLAGPPLLKEATGEIATDEELGGAEMHCQVAGTSEYLAQDDADGIRIAREIMRNLNWQPPALSSNGYAEPLYSAEELLGVVPADPKIPYRVQEIVARIADGSELLEFKNEFDDLTFCGHIAICGQRVGVIGNNGPITANGSAKAAQFIQLCDQSSIPILFLHNTTGFMVGTESEQAGIIRHGSKFIQAVANARVPKISIVVGGSYGAGHYAMCGRGFDPRFIFSWPNAKIAVMGAEQAAGVLKQVAAAGMKRKGAVDQEKLTALYDSTKTMMEQAETAIAYSARLWDDGIIDPRDTRRVLGELLAIINEADARTLNSNSFGVARV